MRQAHRCTAVLAALFTLALAPVQGRGATPVPTPLLDHYFGVALYHARQDEHFEAIARLDAELGLHYDLDQPERDSLSPHRARAELYVGDLELDYRMNRRGGRAMARLLADGVPADIRDEAAYRLARLAFEKREYDKGLAALDRMSADPDPGLARRAGLLRGQLLLALERPDEAARVLEAVSHAPEIGRYVAYNHAVALLRSERPVRGLALLRELGRADVADSSQAALRDKANLVLGFTLLQQERPKSARAPLQRVRLDGPFSGKALLWYGWSDAARDRYEQALVAWMELRERDPADSAVQEALLAAPYAFSELGSHGRAAVLYGEAVETFGAQIASLDESVRSIREGRFLEELVARDPKPLPDGSGAFDLDDLPDSAPTRYLADLMAGRAFQQSWLNYRDLSELLDRVRGWQSALPAFRDLIERRRRYYEPRLPEVAAGYEQRAAALEWIGERLTAARDERDRLLAKREPMALATSGERGLLQRIDALRERMPADGSAHWRARVDRLEGVLRWPIRTTYADRLSRFHEHIQALSVALEQAEASRLSLQKRKESVPLLYEGYDGQIDSLAERLGYLRNRIEGLRAQQGRFIEQAAIEQLNARKARLRRYQTKARFAAAENYDRATTGQDETPPGVPADNAGEGGE